MNGDEGKATFLREAEAMYEELRAWREAHPAASFDEIADQVATVRSEQGERGPWNASDLANLYPIEE